jgi:hypothetical protein
MMLRWISLVPPGIVPENDRSHCVAQDPSRHIDGPRMPVSIASGPSASVPAARQFCSVSLPYSLRRECSGDARPRMNFAKPR